MKLCECQNPCYEIDHQNKMVHCIKCGVAVEPFEALYKIACQYKWLENQVMDGKPLTEWIPVEERLPDEGQEVLVSCKGSRGDYVTHDEYDWDYCAWASDSDAVIAWMPLPEPYRPEAVRETFRGGVDENRENA